MQKDSGDVRRALAASCICELMEPSYGLAKLMRDRALYSGGYKSCSAANEEAEVIFRDAERGPTAGGGGLLSRGRARSGVFAGAVSRRTGGVEPGLTQAQSAALEAFEEAGVHGRIEEMPFARYRVDRVARKSAKGSRKATGGEAITAHLCEVSHLEPPQEADRNPTWFSAEKAKRRLLADRSGELGGELAGVVDRAVGRIQRLQIREADGSRNEPLRKVRFEALDEIGSDALVRYLLQNSLPQRNRGEASAARKFLAIGGVGRLQLGSGAPVMQRGRKN